MTEEIFQVRNRLFPLGDSQREKGSLTRLGAQLVVDLLVQLQLAGYAYHIQIGTEDAPVNSTASIDPTLGFALVDNNAGYATFPLNAQVVIANWTTATLINSMLEVDLGKKRYSSGGTAFVPRNLRADTPNTFNGVAYVCAADVVPLAKTAVPGSVELKRGTVVEDVQATPDAAAASIAFTYSARLDPIAVLVDAGSFVLHHGSATADVLSYGSLQFASLDKQLIV